MSAFKLTALLSLCQGQPCPPRAWSFPCPLLCPVSDLRLPDSPENQPPLSASPHRKQSLLDPPQRVSYPTSHTVPPSLLPFIHSLSFHPCLCVHGDFPQEMKNQAQALKLNLTSRSRHTDTQTHKHADTPSVSSRQALQKQWHVKHMNNPHVPRRNCKLGPFKPSVLSELTSQKQTKDT